MRLEYRPFAVLGFTFLTVLLLCVKIFDGLYTVTFTVGVLLALMCLLFKKVRDRLVPIYISVALIISSVLFWIAYENDLKYARNFIDTNAEIEGVIIDEPTYNRSNSRYYYILAVEKIDGREIDTRLRLSIPQELEAQIFDKVRLDVTVYDIASDSADIKQYYNSKGIFLGAFANDSENFSYEIIQAADRSSIRYIVYSIAEEIKGRIASEMPNENGDTIIALLLGDKENLSDELDLQFKEVGIAPVFAVSGLHLSIWVMGLFNILSQLGVKRRINSVVGMTFTVFFMLLTGLSPSVCRSGLMMLLLLSGNLFYRKSDSLNSLGFSAFVLCCANPLIVADGGFLMSFAATLGIVTIYPLIEKNLISKIPDTFIGKIYSGLLSAIAVSVSASIGVFPVTVFQIGYISVLTVFSNVLITFFAAVAMLSGGMIAITYKISAVCKVFTLIAGVFTDIILKTVSLLADLSVTTISTDDFFWKIGTIVGVVTVIVAFIFFKKKLLIKIIAFSTSVIIAVTGLASYFYYDNLTQLRLLDVGNGVGVIAFKGDKKILMVSDADGYNMYSVITDNLNSISRSDADLLLVGDTDGVYNSSVLELVRSYGFNDIIVSQSNLSLNSVCDDENIIESSNTLIDIWDGAAIDTVITEKYSIAYCNFNGITVLIIFDSYKYADIPNEYLQADYLISNGYIPNKIKPQDYKNIFICGEEKYMTDIETYVVKSGGRPVLVSRFDNVIINIRESGHKIYTLEG